MPYTICTQNAQRIIPNIVRSADNLELAEHSVASDGFSAISLANFGSSSDRVLSEAVFVAAQNCTEDILHDLGLFVSVTEGWRGHDE